MKPSKAKVLMVSSVHRWNDVRVYYKEALSLAKVADVRLIAVWDGDTYHTPNGAVTVEFLPTNGTLPANGESLLLRLKRIGLIVKSAFNCKYDIFHFHDPELMPIGWLVKLRGKKVIYDVHEDFKSSVKIRPWIPRPLVSIIGAAERAAERLSLHIFDRFILAEAAYQEFFQSPTCKVVQNYFLAGTCHPPVPRNEDQSLKLVYAGGLTVARGAVEMLTAVQQLRIEGLPVTLDLFGNTIHPDIKDLLQAGRSEGWLSYHGFVTYPVLVELLPQFHVGLSPLRDHDNYRHSLPTKLLDYLAAGLAVIASDLPRTAEIAGDTSGIVLHRPGDMDELKRCIHTLLHEPSRFRLAQKGSRAVARYSWATQEQVLLGVYQDVLG